MRIACLLPSATDICVALGLSDQIVGVTHECDIEAVRRSQSKDSNGNATTSKIRILTKSGLDPNNSNTQAEIDEQVKQAASSNSPNDINSIYPILEDEFHIAKPTIVLTQNLCSVCAPSIHDVEVLVGERDDDDVKILSLDPHSLLDVAETFVKVAKLCGVEERGQAMKDEFITNLELVSKTVNMAEKKVEGKVKKQVLLLEWIDPPYDAGHWIPDMIEATGCSVLRIKPTTKSKRITWDNIYAKDPDIVIIACCGFDLERNVKDAMSSSAALKKLRAAQNECIFACNGDKYFTRPGPRLLEGVLTIARCAYDTDEDVIRALNTLNFVSEEDLEWEKVPLFENEDQGCNAIVEDIEDIIGTTEKDFMAIHKAACSAGEMVYVDPSTGYNVFTELAHKRRGKCCGSGCRHCPYNHENVKDKASKIMQPAFLYNGSGDHKINRAPDDQPLIDREIKILFFSGGKDSFLTIRALLRSNKSRKKVLIILLTTFDSTSRVIAHQEMHIETVVKQATHLNLPLLGVPVHRASKESYTERISRALNVIAEQVGGKDKISSLVFGDLHLEHIRSWREKELGPLGYHLEFPLWQVSFVELSKDLQASGIKVVVSASTKSGIDVGDEYNQTFLQKILDMGEIDMFGENGEFHTVAQVWVVSRDKALGV